MLRLMLLCIFLVSAVGFSLPNKDVVSYDKGTVTISELKNRIHGGQDADIGEYPSLVSILNAGRHKCGGTIISEKYILTAAHCITPVPKPGTMKIRVGTNDWKTGTDYEAVSFYPHPNYKSKAKEDIGLIEVSPPIVFNDLVQPAKLPAQDQETTVGLDAIVVGWGHTKSSNKVVNQLQEGFLFISDHQKCVKIFASVTEKQICAGVPEGGISSCNGDSGGPLYVDDEIVGIVAWGPTKCAHKGVPAVYTRVSAFRDWITEHSGV